MMGARDGERGSYPEIVNTLAEHGAQGKTDAHALYRRVVFNVLISNVDDHLRNHGFLWLGKAGWSLSPAYDLNPVPTDLKARVLTTNIDLDESTCSLDLLQAASEYFVLSLGGKAPVVRLHVHGQDNGLQVHTPSRRRGFWSLWPNSSPLRTIRL